MRSLQTSMNALNLAMIAMPTEFATTISACTRVLVKKATQEMVEPAKVS